MNRPKPRYHHGNLAAALLRCAGDMIRVGGIDTLSMRKLAERCEVSRTAAYHHFKDKNALLCAIAEEGFRQQSQRLAQLPIEHPELDGRQLFERYVLSYIRNACQQPELYELMYGKAIWQQGQATESLQQVSRSSFRHWVDWIERLQQQQLITDRHSPLRVAQASWATLHGLCRLLIDGIYLNTDDLEEMGRTAVSMLLEPAAS